MNTYYIYLIKCKGFVKVGYAADLMTRLKNFQTGNPFKIELLGKFISSEPHDDEASLHNELAQYHHAGEWFKLPKERLAKLVEEFSVKEKERQISHPMPVLDRSMNERAMN